MKAWSNIQISSNDPEIIKINDFEKKLGELPHKVTKIRALITRFEVCHFKYQKHLVKIKDSIINLEPVVDSDKIGINHIRHGESAWKNDTTGRSLIGQQYIWAIQGWLNDNQDMIISDNFNKSLSQQIQKWLGDKSPDKIRLARLILARLTWDWELYGELQHGEEFKDIELQACRIDICHYAFPNNLELMLKSIGEMKAVEEKEFEGCGSYNENIKVHLEKEFLDLNDMLKIMLNVGNLEKNDLVRIWLISCLIKTIKENIKLTIPITDITYL